MTKWRVLSTNGAGRGICERTGRKTCRQSGCARSSRQKYRLLIGTGLTDLPSIRSLVCRGPMLRMLVASARHFQTLPALLVRIPASLPDYSGTWTGLTLTICMERAAGSTRCGWAIACWQVISCHELHLVRVRRLSLSRLRPALDASATPPTKLPPARPHLLILRLSRLTLS